MQPLSNKTVPNRVERPIRILQFGAGNFIRAFTDWMIDELNEQTSFNSSVVVVKPTYSGRYEHLRRQDGLFHVVLKGIKNGELYEEKKLVKCIREIINPYWEWKEYLKLAENSDIRFVISNTTEAGIRFNPEENIDDKPPKEFPAKLCVWLYQRFRHFSGSVSKSCIFLPLELVEQNGDLLKKCLLQYAELWAMDEDFKAWIEVQTFCNTLVDRIVSGFPERDVKKLETEIGFKDNLIVEGEYYHSWIIEGPERVQKELPFSETDLNVKFVKDLNAHREIKVRILNGAHTSMVPLGYLAGTRTVLDVMTNLGLRKFIKEELFKEIIPTLDHPKEELDDFAKATLERFSNPILQHRLLDIALNSTTKFETRLLPSILQYQKITGQLPRRIIFAFAALIRFYKGEWNGEHIPLKDEEYRKHFFKMVWSEYGDSMKDLAKAVLGNKALWHQNLNKVSGLRELLTFYLEKINSPSFDVSTINSNF